LRFWITVALSRSLEDFGVTSSLCSLPSHLHLFLPSPPFPASSPSRQPPSHLLLFLPFLPFPASSPPLPLFLAFPPPPFPALPSLSCFLPFPAASFSPPPHSKSIIAPSHPFPSTAYVPPLPSPAPSSSTKGEKPIQGALALLGLKECETLNGVSVAGQCQFSCVAHQLWRRECRAGWRADILLRQLALYVIATHEVRAPPGSRGRRGVFEFWNFGILELWHFGRAVWKGPWEAMPVSSFPPLGPPV